VFSKQAGIIRVKLWALSFLLKYFTARFCPRFLLFFCAPLAQETSFHHSCAATTCPVSLFANSGLSGASFVRQLPFL